MIFIYGSLKNTKKVYCIEFIPNGETTDETENISGNHCQYILTLY